MGQAILDIKLFTNMPQFYNGAIVSAPIGKSDHDISYPKQSPAYKTGKCKLVTIRVNGHNERVMFVHYLQQMRWENLYQTDLCNDKAELFTSSLQDLYDTFFPEKLVIRHEKDKPWVTDHFKSLICRRQRAKEAGDMSTFKRLRNQVNRLSPKLRCDFYNTKVKQLKKEDNRRWWKDMKCLIGLNSKDEVPLQQLADTTCDGDIKALTNDINDFFKSVSDDIEPLKSDSPFLQQVCEVPSKYVITVDAMEKRLAKVKANKAGGPDCLPSWIFREFSHILAGPMASIANASLRQGTHPSIWKLSNTVPVPKVNPPKSIESDLRPIALTSIASKILEYFPCSWIYDSIKEQIDPNQFGGVKGSSTTHALITLIDFIAKATDKQKTYARMLLCDFSKAFDLVDHNILLRKLADMDVPSFLVKWAASFLFNRQQQVKIGQHVSKPVSLNAGCPQGTLFGPLAFVSHINDLCFPKPSIHVKFVDDTESVNAATDPKDTTTQKSATHISNWSKDNNMKLNRTKTKDMIFSFQRKEPDFDPIIIDNCEIERVKEAKVLGLTITDDLKWNAHVEQIVKKANKRLFLLTLLKRAGVDCKDIVDMYTSLIRPVLEYACPVFHAALPKYLQHEIESVQKRALTTICGLDPYEDNL